MRTAFLVLVSGMLMLALGACASPARSVQMVPSAQSPPTTEADSPLYRSVSLLEVAGGEETDPAWTSEVGDVQFAEALRMALDRHGFLSPEKESAPYKLKAFIVEVRQPLGGFTIIVDALVRYSLIRAEDGGVVFDEILRGSYTATTEDAFYGVKRLQLANEGAVRSNIEALLQRLHSAEFST